MARLLVEAAGPLTTIQDAGRFGHLRYGVTWSGPVEPLGFAAAQAALGSYGPAVELSHGGITLRCTEGSVRFALAGGDFAATLDGVTLGSWTIGVLTPGARLVVRDGVVGNWATLAFDGDIDCPRWLGSAATLALAGFGGGRLVAGDVLRVDTRAAGAAGDAAPRGFAPPPVESGAIRVVLGPQQGWFSAESLAALTREGFVAAPAFDRMGMVLEGPALVPLAVTMLSAPVIRGGVQVNGAGTATILLADHQTTAGYPRIATVISADLPRAAQVRPGQALRFAVVEAGEAVAIARQLAAARGVWLSGLGRGGSLLERLLGANLIDGVVDAWGD